MLRSRPLVMVFCLLLAACGTSKEDRAISGGGLGAAGGLVVGAVTGLTLLEGALIGAGGGAAIGALTDAEDFNLGGPIWKRFNTTASNTASGEAAKTSNMVAATQANLQRLGYRPGPVDGLYGPQTSQAIRQYQEDYGLPVNGELSGQLAMHIENEATGLPQ